MKKLQKWCRVLYTYFIGYSCASMPKRTGISILIKTKNTLSSPYGRGAAVFEARAENYGCGEGADHRSK